MSNAINPYPSLLLQSTPINPWLGELLPPSCVLYECCKKSILAEQACQSRDSASLWYSCFPRRGLLKAAPQIRITSPLGSPCRSSRRLLGSRFRSFLHTVLAMPDVRPEQSGVLTLSQAEALLAGVLAAAKAALPEGLDVLVWGAARAGDQATLRYLLATGGRSSWTPSKDDEVWGRDTCLRMASRFGHEGAVKELLETGMDVDEVRTDNGATALCLAAQNGHEGVVEMLLKAEADVNKARTDNGCTPLYMAAQNGHEGVVDQLLKAEADVNKARTDCGITPLYMAAQKGHEGVVEQLLKAEADVNKARTNDGSALGIASLMGYSRVCSLLLEAGANVNHANGNGGWSALSIAVMGGHREVALVLMEHGASDDTLTQPMLKTLCKWTMEALKEKHRVIAENNKQMEEMVQGIPEWCAQAASSVAAEGQNDGGGSSSAPAQPSQPPAGVGRKRKAPSTAE